MVIDYEDAARLARWCIAARTPLIPPRIDPDGIELIADQKQTVERPGVDLDVRGTVLADPARRRLLMIFRGVDNWRDAWHFWRPGTMAHHGCTCHGGTLSQYLALAPPLIAAVGERIRRGDIDSIVCTGGSGGGAMALLAALDVRAQGFNQPVAVRSFGSPKVFVRDAVERVEARLDDIVRFANFGDPVPYWPLRAEEIDPHTALTLAPTLVPLVHAASGYAHVGPCVTIGGPNRPHVGPGTPPADITMSLVDKLLVVTKRHYLEAYLDRLEAQAAKAAAETPRRAWLPGVLAAMLPAR